MKVLGFIVGSILTLFGVIVVLGSTIDLIEGSRHVTTVIIGLVVAGIFPITGGLKLCLWALREGRDDRSMKVLLFIEGSILTLFGLMMTMGSIIELIEGSEDSVTTVIGLACALGIVPITGGLCLCCWALRKDRGEQSMKVLVLIVGLILALLGVIMTGAFTIGYFEGFGFSVATTVIVYLVLGGMGPITGGLYLCWWALSQHGVSRSTAGTVANGEPKQECPVDTESCTTDFRVLRQNACDTEVDLMNESITFEITAQAGRKGVWRVSLGAEALTLAAVEGNESFQISRADAEEKIELHMWRFHQPILVVIISKKRIVFKCEQAPAALVKEWLGPPTIRGLNVALKRWLRWCIPLGILYVVVSLPLPADPEIGEEAVPFDPFMAFLGITLVAITLLARIWPQRVWFLLSSIWLSMMAIDVALNIYHGDSWWWSIVVIFVIVVAKRGVSEYQRFATVSNQ